MKGGWLFGLCVLLALGFADYLTLSGTRVAETTFDSGIFLRCAESSPLSLEFYTAVRPPTVPLLYKLVGSDPENIRTLQSALSVACWFALGLALASLFVSELMSSLVLVATCAFSLSSPINQWDGVVMSESVFLSLLVATIAVTIASVRAMFMVGRVPGSLAALWFLVTLLFAGSRDSAVYFLVVPWGAGVVWFLSLVFRSWTDFESPISRGGLTRALAAGLLILVASQLSLHHSKRWQTPLLNVILNRVLPDAELHEQWVAKYDLPRDPLFEAQANQFAWDRVGEALQLRKMIKPRFPLAAVGDWLRERGVRSYQRHLLIDEPVRSLREAVNGLDMGVNPEPPVGPGVRESSYSKGAGITAWSQQLTRVTYVVLPTPLWITLVAVALAVCGLFFDSGLRAPAYCALLLLTGAFVQAFVTWHGDAAEVERHTLVVGVLARLGLGLLVVMALALFERKLIPIQEKAANQPTSTKTAAVIPDAC